MPALDFSFSSTEIDPSHIKAVKNLDPNKKFTLTIVPENCIGNYTLQNAPSELVLSSLSNMHRYVPGVVSIMEYKN